MDTAVEPLGGSLRAFPTAWRGRGEPRWARGDPSLTDLKRKTAASQRGPIKCLASKTPISQEEPDSTSARAGNHPGSTPCAPAHPLAAPLAMLPEPHGAGRPGQPGPHTEGPYRPRTGMCRGWGGLGLDPTTSPSPLTCQRPRPWPQALLGQPRPHPAHRALFAYAN